MSAAGNRRGGRTRSKYPTKPRLPPLTSCHPSSVRPPRPAQQPRPANPGMEVKSDDDGFRSSSFEACSCSSCFRHQLRARGRLPAAAVAFHCKIRSSHQTRSPGGVRQQLVKLQGAQAQTVHFS
ncbi:unnamed protein product [Urochloa humidicola]